MFLALFFLTITPIWDNIDLEKETDPFCLETKKIEIPGYPAAFNPSILSFQGRYLMIFRTGSYQSNESSTFISTVLPEARPRRTDEMALVFLDKDFQPIGDVEIVNIQHHHGLRAFHQQDPRLVEAGGHVYIVYSNMVENTETPLRRVFVSEIFFDGHRFSYGAPEYLCYFENPRRVEKNWPPFAYEDTLLLAYSIVPHRILMPQWGGGSCPTIACTHSTVLWDFGEIRGGTPALLDEGEYLAFFHSSKPFVSKQSEGKKMVHYFMGAYTFASSPPFQLTRISPRPIVGKNFYNGQAYTTWKPLRVVFPGGLLIEDNYVYVFYGRQDHEIWVVKMDKKGLLKSLVSSG